MAEQRRINTVLGGVARSVGPDRADLATLERRREEHERKTAPPPKLAFAEHLASSAAEGAALSASAGAEAARAEEGSADQSGDRQSSQFPRPRGRQRLIRG